MYVGGNNHVYQLGIPSDAKNNNKYVSKMTEIPGINVQNIICIAPGWQHSVLVMNNGDILASGKVCSILGSRNSQINENFSKITVCEEEVTWAAAGDNFTLYQTKSGRVILYHRDESEKIEVQLQNRALCVFGGKEFGGVIDEDGCAYFIGMCDPRRVPTPVHFDSPAVELVCCTGFKAVLLSDHRVFGNGKLNNNSDSFTHVSSLAGHKIIKISGYSYACLVLSDDGLVFSYGSNNYGQLGNDSTTINYERFQQVSIPGDAKIKDIACSFHSLILSIEGELFGCGWNKYNQLFHESTSKNVQQLVKIDVTTKLNYLFAGNVFSIVISGVNLPENPAKKMFNHSILNFIHYKIDQQNQNISQFKDRINEINDIIIRNNRCLEKKIDQQKEANSQMSALISVISKGITHSNEESIKRTEELKAKSNSTQNQIEVLQGIMNQMRQDSEQLKNQLSDIKTQISQSDEGKDLKISRLESHLLETNNQTKEFKTQLHQEREESRRQIESYQQQISSLMICIANQGMSIIDK